MKVIKLDLVQEKLFYEKLDNGLEIYIIRKKDFNSNYASFISKFGGLDIEFIPINEKEFVTMPPGIAHFLEHKLFEQEKDPQVHDFYKQSGTYVNAMTGYKRTKYIFKGPSNFKKNLEFLLDFVQSPYFTDENIEKEKGIIIEEAKMCMDDKSRLFHETIMKNLFNKVPYDKKIIGEIEDIKSMTKEDIYKCFNSFYHPTNMALLIVTNEDEESVLEIIRNNQKNKVFKKDFRIIKKDYDEDINVRKEFEEVITDVKETRVGYSLKFCLKDFNASKREVYDYLYILFGILVGNLSKFNLSLKEKNVIKNDIGYSIDNYETNNDTFITTHFYGLTDNVEEFIELLEKQLMSNNYTKEDFELYKKSSIADINYGFNSVNGIMGFMSSEYEFDGKIDNNSIMEEININYDRFKEVIKNFNLKHKSIVVMKGE
ncbi:MAG: insulinase family protein [Bacilli bacterium]|nr:insulinase family protein [Bacilli bacterium]